MCLWHHPPSPQQDSPKAPHCMNLRTQRWKWQTPPLHAALAKAALMVGPLHCMTCRVTPLGGCLRWLPPEAVSCAEQRSKWVVEQARRQMQPQLRWPSKKVFGILARCAPAQQLAWHSLQEPPNLWWVCRLQMAKTRLHCPPRGPVAAGRGLPCKLDTQTDRSLPPLRRGTFRRGFLSRARRWTKAHTADVGEICMGADGRAHTCAKKGR
jgi:hypothetical protein